MTKSPSSSPPLRQILGINIRLERVRQRLTQEALAAAAETNQNYISEIERGISAPTVDVIEKVARALDVPASDLFDETMGKRPPRSTRG